jgi:hypothetical protein
MINNNFVICKGYHSDIIERKKLIFYHVPKSAGTSICNILSTLISDSLRLLGPLTVNSGFTIDRSQITSEQFLLEEKKNLINKKFIYGHFSINSYNFFLNSFSITLIRNPIDRAISHYNYQIQRNVIDTKTNLASCFNNGFIPDNIITRQFSGNINNKISIDDYHIAFKNLKEKINLIFDFDNSASLIDYIISIYDLPNVIFQKQRITKKNYLTKNKENLSIIKIYNEYDIKLYNKIKKEQLFFNIPKNIYNRKKEKTLFWSQNDPFYGTAKMLIKKDVNEIISYIKSHKP